MPRPLSLAHLSALALSPPDLITHAAAAGFDAVGLRLRPVTAAEPAHDLIGDAALMRATRAALRATGIAVADVEFLRLGPDLDPAGLAPFLAAGAELGARRVIAAPYDPDPARLRDRLADLAARAAAHGLEVALEFFPWTPAAADLAAGWALVRDAPANVGLLVDALHFDRSASSHALLARLPAARLALVHLCDAPVAPPYDTAALLHCARAARLPPGEGAIDLARFLRALPAATPIGVEVPNPARLAALGPAGFLARLHDRARAVLAAGAEPGPA